MIAASTTCFEVFDSVPIQFVEERTNWQGSMLTFSMAMAAKMGFVSTPIKGLVEVTDTDITSDADLGLLECLIPTSKARASITDRIRGLLT